MSATGRSDVRLADDFYVTPDWTVDLILPHLGWKPYADTMTVLDPAAGDGAIIRRVEHMLNGCFDSDFHATVRGIEIDPERSAKSGATCADALTVSWGEPDLVIMNPPFSLAQEFCEKAIQEVATGGEVAALMRLSMLEGACRSRFWQEHPADVFVLGRRPSFTEYLRWRTKRCNGLMTTPSGKPRLCEREAGHEGPCLTIGTDAAAYGWFVWGPGRGNRWWRLDE